MNFTASPAAQTSRRPRSLFAVVVLTAAALVFSACAGSPPAAPAAATAAPQATATRPAPTATATVPAAAGLKINAPWARAALAQGPGPGGMGGTPPAGMGAAAPASGTPAAGMGAMPAGGTPPAGMAMGAGGGSSMGSFPGRNHSAMYMTIQNPSGTPDRLIKAESTVSEAVELHETSMQEGMMRMQQVQGIAVPAQGAAELKPGGFHVMLIALKQDLKAGDKVGLTLTFERAGKVAVDAEVRQP